MNIITGSVAEIREDSSVAGPEALEWIEEAADRILSIFDHHRNIFQVLTSEAGPEEIALVPMLESLIEECRETYPDATFSLDAPKKVVVSAHPQLRQALRELLENAVTHNDEEIPAVSITVDRADAAVSVNVIDNGPTIPAMEREAITGQITAEPTAHSQSLGLWFVYWVVTQSDGELSFRENVPRGNRIVIELSLTRRNWKDDQPTT